MTRPTKPETNRNGHIGRFEEFMPVRRTMEELVAASFAARREKAEAAPRSCVEVADLGDARLVRYRIGSGSLMRDLETFGNPSNRWFATSDVAAFTAVFGIVEKASDEASAILVVMEDREEGARLLTVDHGKEFPPRPETVLAALKELDVPPTWRHGVDSRLAERFDLWFDAEGGSWETRAPQELVVVTMARRCFATRPVMVESVDVFLLPDEAWPLSGADADTVYWAKDHYRVAAFDRIGELGYGVRKGFSSWSPDGDPQVVKVTGSAIDADVEALLASASAPSP